MPAFCLSTPPLNQCIKKLALKLKVDTAYPALVIQWNIKMDSKSSLRYLIGQDYRVGGVTENE